MVLLRPITVARVLAMNKFSQIWPIVVPVLIGLLLYGCVVLVWNRSYHGLSILMSDTTAFNYDHNLPRGYESKTTSRLEILQVAAIAYAQHHKGTLPPMQTSGAAFSALRGGMGQEAKYYFQNPATQRPLTPNATLSGRKMGVVSQGGTAILFYDADPPAGFRESYYVTIKGVVGHVPVTDLPKLLQASTQE